MMKLNIIFFFISLLGFVTACNKEEMSTDKIITNNPKTDAFDKMVDEIILPYAQKQSTGSVSIGIFKDNKTKFYAYGEKQKGNSNLPDSLTYYEIGSITKTFTAIMMADYLQQNNLSVETPINSFLPGDIPLLKFAGESIKIKHLLNHTSGLPNLPADCNISNPTSNYDSTKVFNYLKNLSLSKKPGETYQYSNLGIGIVGIILERKTHKNYSQMLKEIITTPLNLQHTKIVLNKTDSLNLATGYDDQGQQSSYDKNYWNYLSGFTGSGAIKSNIADMLKYGRNILNPGSSVLNRPISLCGEVSFQDIYKHGFDWITLVSNGQEVLFHDGGTAGFSSFIFVCKSRKIVIVMLFSNVSDEIPTFVNNLALEIIK